MFPLLICSNKILQTLRSVSVNREWGYGSPWAKKWFDGNKKKPKHQFDPDVSKESFWIELTAFFNMQTRVYENIVCWHKIISFVDYWEGT